MFSIGPHNEMGYVTYNCMFKPRSSILPLTVTGELLKTENHPFWQIHHDPLIGAIVSLAISRFIENALSVVKTTSSSTGSDIQHYNIQHNKK
jgi:hypothetical protein